MRLRTCRRCLSTNDNGNHDCHRENDNNDDNKGDHDDTANRPTDDNKDDNHDNHNETDIIDTSNSRTDDDNDSDDDRTNSANRHAFSDAKYDCEARGADECISVAVTDTVVNDSVANNIVVVARTNTRADATVDATDIQSDDDVWQQWRNERHAGSDVDDVVGIGDRRFVNIDDKFVGFIDRSRNVVVVDERVYLRCRLFESIRSLFRCFKLWFCCRQKKTRTVQRSGRR